MGGAWGPFLKICAVAAIIEGLFWLFGMISMQTGNAYYLFDPHRLAAEITANLPKESAASPNGYLSHDADAVRKHPTLSTPICGSAWGGSFTFADDVTDAEAWPYRLSLQLGCLIENRGVDGYGVDQTLLSFETHPPRNSLIILGFAHPMILVDSIASWTFVNLGKDHLPHARSTKPFFNLDGDKLKLVSRPAADISAIERHYALDRYSEDWTRLRFPFTFHVARAIYRRFTSPRLANLEPLDQGNPTAREWRVITTRLIERMAKVAEASNDRFVVLLIPKPETPVQPMFSAMLQDLHSTAPSACVVDATEEVRAQIASLPNPDDIMTATKHYSAPGNDALVKALLRGMAKCGISS